MMFKIARLPKKANLAGAKDAKLWVSIGNSIAVKDCQATEECFPTRKIPAKPQWQGFFFL